MRISVTRVPALGAGSHEPDASPQSSTKQLGYVHEAGLKLMVSEVCTDTGRPFMA